MTQPRWTFADFDLLITPAESGYGARTLASPAGESKQPVAVTLPFTPQELAAFLAVRRGEPGAATLLTPRALGQGLYAAVFAGEVGDLFQRSLDLTRERGEGLRIRLRLGEVPELADLPWEYLYLPGPDRFAGLSTRTPILRYLALDQPVAPLAVTPPLTILAVLADPRNEFAALDVAGEWRRLQTALAPLTDAGRVTLERLDQATLPALQARLRGEAVHILHFVGHGYYDPVTQQGGLVFEDELADLPALVDARKLSALLGDHDSLRLVFLNACEGARGSQSTPFAGVAQRLVQQGIPGVVAMQFPVTDGAALLLSQSFYQSVADGYGVEAALAEARKALFTQESGHEWGAPVLFSRAGNGRLFQMETGEETGEETAPSQAAQPAGSQTIHTGGGAYIRGNVTIGGDFVGRDKIVHHAPASSRPSTPSTKPSTRKQ